MPKPRDTSDVQLSLFDLDTLEIKPTSPAAADVRPLPLIIADKWGFSLQHHVIDGVYWFSVHDWYAGVAQIENARRDVEKLSKRNPELSNKWDSMEYRAVNGRRYQMPYGQDAAMYEIVQQMQSTTGIAKQVNQYLVKAGVILDRARRDKTAATALSDSLDAMHGRIRADSIDSRKDYADATVETHYQHAPKIGLLTNENYKALFGLAKQQLCIELGLKPSASNLRDYMNKYALLAITATETHAAELMRQLNRSLTDDEQIMVGRQTAAQFKPVFESAAKQVGQTLTAPRLTDGK
ncbi:MAG: hypothetical protein ACRC6G_12900 [Deefgea sp.]